MSVSRYYLTALAALILSTLVLSSCHSPPPEEDSSQNKAAIIDQLCLLESNPAFIEQAGEILTSSGFEVDLWQGEQITVDFYRNLPACGYKIIVFRAHSGLLLSAENQQMVASDTTYLFTGERYTTTKHVSEQLTGRVSNAMMSDQYPLIFAVNSEFILQDLKDDFNNTVILMMGCETHYLDDLANAFIEKGASVYLGWSTLVSLEYVDEATINLLKKLCLENLPVEQGVTVTMTDMGTDPYFHAHLKYFPARSGLRTITELIK